MSEWHIYFHESRITLKNENNRYSYYLRLNHDWYGKNDIRNDDVHTIRALFDELIGALEKIEDDSVVLNYMCMIVRLENE